MNQLALFNYRVSYVKKDSKGVVHFVNDVMAMDLVHAKKRARKMLKQEHPDDWAEFDTKPEYAFLITRPHGNNPPI